MNHGIAIDEKADTFFGKNLFILRDQKWRDMRSTLSPAFTGSKMRHMFNLIASISNEYLNELNRSITTEKEIEFVGFSSKYCNDVIARCSFGVSINSLVDPANEFYTMGRELAKFPFSFQLKFLLYSAFPKLMNVSKKNFHSFHQQLEDEKFFPSFSKSKCSTRHSRNSSPT